jgi:hypothetical protein
LSILALGAQYGKFDGDLRTSALLGTPSVQYVHDYYPFAHRLAPMAAELVNRMASLVVARRFLGVGVADSCPLLSGSYFRMQHFVRRSTFGLFPFDGV